MHYRPRGACTDSRPHRASSLGILVSGFVSAAAGLALVGLAAPASATLFGQELTVELISPADSLMLSDTVIAADATQEILPDDGSEIGSVLLASEFIDFDERMDPGVVGFIEIGFEAGAPGGTTGFGTGARYEISGLYLGTTLGVIGATLVQTDLAGASVLFDLQSVTIFIDEIVIDDFPSGVDTGTVRVDLLIGVPEPGSLTLWAAGLVALAIGVTRRRP